MVESFKYLAHHIQTCGEEFIRVISEEEDDYIDQLHAEYNDFLEKTKHIFPHSKDWAFLDKWKGLPVDELKEKWVEENKIENEDERTKLTGVLAKYEVQGGGNQQFRGEVVLADGSRETVLGSARQLPEVNRSYIIIGVRREHAELGKFLEIHKMIPVSNAEGGNHS
ncbi:hypothetical protein ACFSO0_13745 [Brevibacillus sp. GCM10020057]|uniref:hypothetical protein n=1 Tax=Brevibacillus sp. GCM10020057 TaxID=3317327 RepID=UPI003624E353